MLLSTQNRSESPVGGERTNAMEEYLHILSGQEKEPDTVAIDHSYCKLWHLHPDSHHVKPARLLFMKGLLTRNESSSECNADIDVETVASKVTPPYDDERTRLLSNECDQFLTTSLPSDGDEDKEPLNKSGWSITQKNLYKHVIKILNGNRLSRLACSDSPCELVKRRIMIDKGASKMRQVFASNSWDMKLLSWLHCTLIDTISTSLLSEYFEIMRTLKVKMSNLVDKLLAQFGTFHAKVFGACSTEAFNQLIQKPWDPVSNALSQCKQRKLPSNAVIIVIPSAPNQPSVHLSNRVRFWNGQLASLGKVIQMPLHISHSISVEECLHQLFTAARNKVVEMRSQTPTRPIILLGWTIGALIACHVALEEPVSAVVCMGFPLKGVSGSRGDLDDPLLDSKIATLFVVGQNSSTCSMDDIEDFRERMRAETGLVVVGGADDLLRVSVTKKKNDGITQAMVDKCIADEIEDFLVPILSHQNAATAAAVPAAATSATTTTKETTTNEAPLDDAKRQRRKPREYSPEISPVKKKPRPVGRPSIQKAAPSSTSSDTSSAGSGADESTGQKEGKGLRCRTKSKSRLMRMRHLKNAVEAPVPATAATTSVQKINEGTINTNDSPNQNLKDKDETPVTSTPTPVAKLNPAKILAEQLRSGPVDVEKAFGKDCSFLPRPLTPTDFDGDESPTKVTKLTDCMTLPEGNITADNKPSHTQITLVTQTSPSVVGVPFTSILGSEKQKISFLQTSDTHGLTTLSNPTLTLGKSPVAKIPDTILDNKTKLATLQRIQSCDLVTGLNKTAITSPQTKILTTNSTLNVKQMQGIVSSLTSKGLLSSAINSSNTQTVLVSSPNSANKSTFIVSNNDSTTSSPNKIQFHRMLVQACASPLRPKLTSTVNVVEEGKATTTTEQRVCNLSLLSDVAGMKEPIRQGANESSATLVKLSSESGPVKQYKLVESFPSCSSLPQRLETPEEQAEKQMAIRALSSSLREDGNSSGSYSKFENPHPMLGYSIIMPRPVRGLALRQPRRPRGRVLQGIRKPRVRHFYPFD